MDNIKRGNKKKWIWIVAGSLVVLLIILRLALPSILLKFVNKKLAEIDGYYGHVEDIDVALIRGAYTINKIKLDKSSGKIPVPFFAANAIDISVEWKALFQGSLVAEIVVTDPLLNFVKGPTEATSQTSIDKDWIDVVDEMLPLKLNRFEVNNGEIFYHDYHSSPKVDISMKQVHILAQNLSNTNKNNDLLPSTVSATAITYGGNMTFDMKLNALSRIPAFDLNAQLNTLNLPDLNAFLKAYGNFDVQEGNISIYSEAATKDNKITGYVKPIIKDLKVLDLNAEQVTASEALWESIVGLGAWIFKNKPKDQLATTVEFTGDLKDPDIDLWTLVGETLRNAFIQALYPSLEHSVSIQSITKAKEEESALEKLFKQSGAKEEKEESGKKQQKKEKKKSEQINK